MITSMHRLSKSFTAGRERHEEPEVRHRVPDGVTVLPKGISTLAEQMQARKRELLEGNGKAPDAAAQ